MKLFSLMLLAFLTASKPLQAQGYTFWNRCGDTLQISLYPADSFHLKQLHYDFGRDQVILYLLRYEAAYPEDQVWVEHRRAGTLINSRYLGGISSGESGVALPRHQQIPGYFVVYKAYEFSGIYHLIGEAGDWYELPGSNLTMNQTRTALFTFVPEECGGCDIGTFDMPSKKMTTRHSTGGKDAWPDATGLTDDGPIFKEVIWIKW